jgi:hypothetical protein
MIFGCNWGFSNILNTMKALSKPDYLSKHLSKHHLGHMQAQLQGKPLQETLQAMHATTATSKLATRCEE